MSADEMFNKLGYKCKREIHENGEIKKISYLKGERFNLDHEATIIEFDLVSGNFRKYFVRFWKNIEDEIYVQYKYINMGELQAINKKVDELGGKISQSRNKCKRWL